MDIASVTTAIGLATSAVGLTGQAATTAQTIRKLFSSESAPDSAEATQLLNTLASELTAANMMNVQISEALRTLNQELQRQNEFEAQKANYELFQTPQEDVVFKLIQDADSDQQPHYVCPVCFNRDKLISYITGKGDFRTCQTDRSHNYRFARTPMPRKRRQNGF